MIGLEKSALVHDVRVCTEYGCLPSDVQYGLKKLDQDVKKRGRPGIINMSFVSKHSPLTERLIDRVFFFHFKYSSKVLQTKCLVVCAAGNYGNDSQDTIPANHTGIIAVASHSRGLFFTEFSGYGC